MKRVTRKQDGGATTCKEDYFIVQYGKNYLTSPYITDYNTHYKLFEIELYLSQFWVPAQGAPVSYYPIPNTVPVNSQGVPAPVFYPVNAQGAPATAPTQGSWQYQGRISEDTIKMIRKLYLIQECIDNFILTYGNNKECINTFIMYVNGWRGRQYIQPKPDKIWFVNKKGNEVEEDIRNYKVSGFDDFVERYSKSLSNFIDKYVKYDPQYNQIINGILVDGVIDNRKVIGVINVDGNSTLFPPDHIPKFVTKLRDDVHGRVSSG